MPSVTSKHDRGHPTRRNPIAGALKTIVSTSVLSSWSAEAFVDRTPWLAIIPVRRGDYLQPDGLGVPSRGDGSDTFQNHMNGGISAGHALHFIMAHHIVGDPEKGDRILRAMLGRHSAVGFQNGARNKANEGIGWATWDGAPR
jgi:hypothetical protein